jgi:hypothetical protein
MSEETYYGINIELDDSIYRTIYCVNEQELNEAYDLLLDVLNNLDDYQSINIVTDNSVTFIKDIYKYNVITFKKFNDTRDIYPSKVESCDILNIDLTKNEKQKETKQPKSKKQKNNFKAKVKETEKENLENNKNEDLELNLDDDLVLENNDEKVETV